VQGQLPADQAADAGDLDGRYGPAGLRLLARRVGALPWWAVSTAVHSVIFLLATLLTVAVPPAQVDEVTISTSVVKKEEQKFDEKLERDIFKRSTEIRDESRVEKPVLVREQAEVSDHFETANEDDMRSARGLEDAISDIPLGGTGVTGSMGVGGGGMAGVFGYRDAGGRKRAVRRFGGSPATESAVEAALRWLARKQESEGYWDYDRHGGKDKYDKIARYDTAMTGIAAEAFLGAGYTHKNGKYRDNVRRALAWLLKHQGDDGRWSKLNYTQGIATLAIVEAYGMTKDPWLREPAQKAIDAVLAGQRPYEAWWYNPDPKGERQNDTSVTSWQVQALKSARIAGLKVDRTAFQGVLNWLEFGQDVKGKGYMCYQGSVKAGTRRSPGTAVTAIAAMSRMYIGQDKENPGIKKPVEFMSGRALPRWTPPGQYQTARSKFYYWYYGTLACFQYGGEPWEKWNKVMKPMLIENQCSIKKGDPAKDDGSWPPEHGNDHNAGRVWTTALGALCLEVYYRYLPLYTK
ncbi:MAG: prenyltransferase/squalene oxidase repeat-containing protein, partial [Planctomycetota bacterium]